MPSSFEQDFQASGTTDLLEVLGEEYAAQQPGAAQPTTITGIFEELEATGLVIEGFSHTDERRALLRVASPSSLDVGWTVTVGSDVWHYSGKGKVEGGLVTVHLKIGGQSQIGGIRRR